MDGDLIIAIVVVTALAFDFTNGFHDTANVVAATISTRAMAPRTAVLGAAVLNFVGAFISIEVAQTVAEDIVEVGDIAPAVIFCGLAGAVAWNLIMWYLGLPSSSTHALIGGLVGATLAAAGTDAIIDDGLVGLVIVPALIAPLVAFVAAALAIAITYRIVGQLRPGPVSRGFRLGQLVSGGMLALSHGTNDAQKTMGVVTLALVANGSLDVDGGFDVPLWVVVSAATAIAAGTYFCGWRIIRNMGMRVIEMDAAQGFTAQGASASVVLAASHFGYPLSTTQVISGATVGAGAGKRLSLTRWGVRGNLAVAWIVTLPAAAAAGGVAYGITTIFGDGVAGPLLVFALSAALCVSLFRHRMRRGQPVPTA